MKEVRARQLIKKYLAGNCTEIERALVEQYFNNDLRTRQGVPQAERFAQADRRMMRNLSNHIKSHMRPLFRRWLPYAAAVLLALGTWFVLDKGKDSQEHKLIAADVAPGGNKATLILDNGQTIDLSEAHTGIVVAEENIIYSDGDTLLLAPSEKLILTTPKGGTYQITLSDGTNVWLNAASTLRYPSRFSEDERLVELEGEAYFDVMEAETQPFRVLSAGQVVEALGTGFNISAYPDEIEVKTTLVEGSVRVTPTDDSWIPTVIKPGQQTITRSKGVEVKNVDTEQFTAWKDGFFYFDGYTPQEVFASLNRWYDIEVIYQGNVPPIQFFGMIERNKSLKSLLSILKRTGFDFEVIHAESGVKLIVGSE